MIAPVRDVPVEEFRQMFPESPGKCRVCGHGLFNEEIPSGVCRRCYIEPRLRLRHLLNWRWLR